MKFKPYYSYYYPIVVLNFNISPSEFWEMTPKEFWLLHKFKYPPKQSEDVARLKKLFDLPEARPSRGIRNDSNT